mmetsp:Transcript_52450/g.98425  ORF Transcript_52450/g.98425 Transcript_52450/m.98425 type:complete len:125 (+) Transcript_52450:80-454(+)
MHCQTMLKLSLRSYERRVLMSVHGVRRPYDRNLPPKEQPASEPQQIRIISPCRLLYNRSVACVHATLYARLFYAKKIQRLLQAVLDGKLVLPLISKRVSSPRRAHMRTILNVMSTLRCQLSGES